MPVICAATGCTNKFIKGSEIRFYRSPFKTYVPFYDQHHAAVAGTTCSMMCKMKFPLSKPQLANQWVHSLGLKNFIPTTNTCLCSEHFRPDCFRDYNGKQFLREDAVPTIFISPQDSSKLQIELRKRGVMPKDTNAINRFGTQADKDKAKEAAMQRKDKRGGFRGGGRGGARSKSGNNDRQTFGAKSKVYDSKGRLLSNGKDMCDCLDIDCMGCFFPCPECGSRKCGVECRCDRKWLYEQVEVEGGEIIRNKFAG